VGRESLTDNLINKSFVVSDYALILEKKFYPPTPANAGAVGKKPGFDLSLKTAFFTTLP
jgi:hypothetical protein